MGNMNTHLLTKKELHTADPKVWNKRGQLKRYALSCGYVEEKKGLRLYMEHGVYQVRGFRVGKPEGRTDGNRDIVPVLMGDRVEAEYHISGSFAHLKEARKFMSSPFTHSPTRSGEVMIARITAGM